VPPSLFLRLEHKRPEFISLPERDGAQSQKEEAMNWMQIEDMWEQAKTKIQRKWGKLTDDDLELIGGRRERLEGKIRQLYGFAPDHVRKEIDDWVRWQMPFGERRRTARFRSALAAR
jgi:uncharacterized protein YjbJ (UPF0337 family)